MTPYHIQIGNIYKSESGRVLASLLRLLGDLDLAEEALQEAFNIALLKWPEEGIPKNPYSWLVSAGKFKAIDVIRRSERGKKLISEQLASDIEESNGSYVESYALETHLVEDDQLRLIFFCCHPLLPLDSRIALSLREVCGMNTEEIAKAYLVSSETMKKRITRAKALIKEKQIPYEIPSKDELNKRVDAVMHVIYLIYNEGYAASSGKVHIRKELAREAVFLSRHLVELVSSPETLGLLALLLLQESRSNARVTTSGDIIPLERQDRTLWDQSLIQEGILLIQQSIMSGRLGPYTLQAAIASVHAVADSIENTRWDLITGYYDMLLSINPSPVIELNRAIAVGMHEGPKAGLNIIQDLIKNEKLNSYHLLYSAQAEFSKKLGLRKEAAKAYERAIELARQEPERRYLKQQLAQISQ